MKLIRPPFFTKIFFPQIITKIKNNKNNIFLTFDDCNNIDCTLKTLEILDYFNIKATFFCTGKNIQNDINILNEIINKKHKIGNHTFNHLNGLKTKTSEYLKDIEKSNEFLKSNLFRPPYGKISLTQYNILKKQYKIILWDILTYDFDSNVKENDILKIIKTKTKSGSIIVFHTNSNTKKKLEFILPLAIEYLKEKKFNFEVIN